MQASGSLKDFEILRKLGQGAFGLVFMVKRKLDGQTYALKKVKIGTMKDKEKDNALNQIRILASLNNQYIVKFKQAFFDSTSNCLCIIMEYAGGGDVLKKINTHIRSRNRISQQEIWKAILHITKALKHLHQSKILHRDLKSANVFIGQDGTYKLGDLNVSKVLKQGLAHTQTGTPYYASPQVWQDHPYDMKSDMWSLGCVIYEMAALQPPFKASDLQSLYKKVKAGTYKQISTYYSSQLSQIISLLLRVKPKERPDADGLLKNPIVKKKCGLKLGSNELQSYFQSQNDPLLKTIKYNPFNLNSIKDKLPKSDYEETFDQKNKIRQRRDSIDNLKNQNRQRVLSACGMRNDNKANYSPAHNNNKKQQYKYNPIKNPIGMGLPPKPIRKQQNNSYKQPINRLRRVGQDIISRGGNRSSSVNR